MLLIDLGDKCGRNLLGNDVKNDFKCRIIFKVFKFQRQRFILYFVGSSHSRSFYEFSFFYHLFDDCFCKFSWYYNFDHIFFWFLMSTEFLWFFYAPIYDLPTFYKKVQLCFAQSLFHNWCAFTSSFSCLLFIIYILCSNIMFR